MNEHDMRIDIQDGDGEEPGLSDSPAEAPQTGGVEGQPPAERGKPDFQVSDRRFWVQDGEAVDRASPLEKRLPSYIEELEARTEAAESKLKEKLAELEADNEAYRGRLRREMDNRALQQTRRTLEGFLEVVDNLERALLAAHSAQESSPLEEGVRLNLELFLDKLRAAGIEPVEMEGKPFDPHLAEAVGAVPVDSPEQDQTVVEVVQKGYLSGDQLLRPARVRIGQYSR